MFGISLATLSLCFDSTIVGELPQQQASSHQGLIKENQLQVKDLNDSPGYFTDGWICHSDIFLHTSSFVKETYNWTQKSSQRLMSDVTQKRSKESVLLVSAQLHISMHK